MRSLERRLRALERDRPLDESDWPSQEEGESDVDYLARLLRSVVLEQLVAGSMAEDEPRREDETEQDASQSVESEGATGENAKA
jgi:hypothetical protein